MKESRVKNTIINLKQGITAQLISYPLSFITRTIFVKYLAVEYLGVNNLFSNIILLFSIVESGIGAAMESVLYGPLYDKNYKLVNSIIFLMKKAYFIVSVVVLGIAVLIYPVLDIFTGITEVSEIHSIYIMFVLKNVCSYWFADTLSLLIVDQKRYIYIKYTQIFNIIQYILQSIVLILTQNFIVYILIQTLCPVFVYVMIKIKCNQMYPFIGKNKLMADMSSEIKNDIKRKCSSGFVMHLSYIIMNGTDTIVITRFSGMAVAGIYSNYLMIVRLISAFLNVFFDSVKGSIGNMLAEDNKELSFRTYNKLFFLTMLTVGFSASCLISLLNPFIKIWIGEQYLLDQTTVVLIALVFVCCNEGFRQIICIFKWTSGLFIKDKWFGLLEGLCNLVMSLVLVQKWGINGVLFSSIISSFITTFSTAYVNYKYIFEIGFKNFFGMLVNYCLKIGCVCIFVYLTSSRIVASDIFDLIILFSYCISTTLIGLLAFFHKNEYFQYYSSIFRRMITGKK